MVKERWRGGGREGGEGVGVELEILIINEILEMRDYQGEINH